MKHLLLILAVIMFGFLYWLGGYGEVTPKPKLPDETSTYDRSPSPIVVPPEGYDGKG